MPIDLETSATFETLILRLAERVGHADQTGTVAAIPDDANTLALIKKCVNEGYDRFLRAHPTGWSFLMRWWDLTLSSTAGASNIDGDPARVKLPGWASGQPQEDWTYIGTNSTRRNVIRTHPTIVDQHRLSSPDVTGIPSICSVRAIASGGPPGLSPTRWEATFFPSPDATYVIRAPFRVHRHQMVDLSERHVAGAQHDQAIFDFSWLVWCEDDAESPDKLTRATAAVYGVPGTMQRGSLAESIALDNLNDADTLGESAPPDLSVYARPGLSIAPNLPLVTFNGQSVE